MNCHLCLKTEWTDAAGYGFRVNDCRKCERPLCEDCAEADYDMIDDPPRYICTQYQCPQACAEKHWERRVTDIAVYQERRQFTNRGKAA